MTSEKGQLIAPAPICREQRAQEVGFGDHSLDPKQLKYVGYLSSEQCEQILEILITQIYQLTGLAQTGAQPWDPMGGP